MKYRNRVHGPLTLTVGVVYEAYNIPVENFQFLGQNSRMSAFFNYIEYMIVCSETSTY